MPSRKFGKTVKPGKELARLFGKKLADATYRLPASNGQQFGRAGILINRENEFGRHYAETVLCVCDRPLNFGRLAVYSDGNRKPKLVHFGCAMRAIAWTRHVMAHCYSSDVCFGPSYAPVPKIAEPVDLTAVWASFHKPAEPEAEPAAEIDNLASAIAETLEAGAAE